MQSQSISRTFSFHNHPVLSPQNVKRLGPQHAPEVEKLTLKITEYLFGSTPAKKQLDSCYLSLGIYNNEKELAGVVCLSCSPNVPAVPPWEWAHWLYNKYGIEDLHTMTTVWLTYAAWDRRYTTLFLKPLLQNLFQSYDVLEDLAMVCPPGIPHLDFLEHCATRVFPLDFPESVKVQSVYRAKKSDFVAQYTIRRAVEEDNDDLVAIIPKVCEEIYGHYYISELLSNEDSQRQIIVAEHKGSAVGVLCLNETINYDLLNDNFELIPYNGLKKHDVADEVICTNTHQSTIIVPLASDYPDFLSDSTVNEDTISETKEGKEEDDTYSEDDFSLINLSSTMLMNLLYEESETSGDQLVFDPSGTSIDSAFSCVVLNEDYQDHVYNADRGDIDVEEKKTRRKESRIDLPIVPVFYGEENAFAMEICTTLPQHENCLYLLFQAAFQCYPERDYLIVSFPTVSNFLYLTKYFARAVPRINSNFPQELYVLHRKAILGRCWGRVSLRSDLRHFSELISHMEKPQLVEESFRDALEKQDENLKAYTFLCEHQIIGGAVVEEEEERDYLELNFNMDKLLNCDYKFGTEGNLVQFIVLPTFQRKISFFMSELHRLSDFQTIYYKLKQYDFLYGHKSTSLANSILTMTPVLPNHLPQYSKQVSDVYDLPRSIYKHHQPFGLYVSTPRLCSMIKFEVNHRLVVVGAGTTALSFLEALIFGNDPYYKIFFTNLIVVSPHGIVYHKQPSRTRDMLFVSDGHLDRRYTDSLCLKTYVHVATGVMSTINRKEKFVGLNDETYIPYDYLFLFCGEQFQKPPEKKEVAKMKRTDFPQNVFIINTEADAGNALNALKSLRMGSKQANIVVYGHYIEAFSCLAALLEYGIQGSNLVYVDPTPGETKKSENHDYLVQFFNNSSVESAVLNEIFYQGVAVYQDYNFVEWRFEATSNYICSARFESKYKFVEIDLCALFIYHSKGVSNRTFQAIAKSGLVFNGRLVIDENCQTNDPYIYGAGPLTMYSKKYHAEHLMHRFYNSQEIGRSLGRDIRKKLTPKEYWDPELPSEIFTKPIVKHCTFPGNLHYLQVSKPGPPVPLEVAVAKSNYGRVLTTGDCKNLDLKGYFRLHLNQFQTVETITCLSKSEFPVRNLISLWGKHEILLNRLVIRYDMNMIPDLFDYFDEPWACALFHRKFPKILSEITEMLAMAEISEGTKVVDEVGEMLENNDWQPLTKIQIDEIEEICRKTNLIPAIEQKVLDFLHDNNSYLPMYVHQLLIRWIKHESMSSPFFVKYVNNPEHRIGQEGKHDLHTLLKR